MAGGRAYLLTAIAEEDQVEEAVALIKNFEGYV